MSDTQSSHVSSVQRLKKRADFLRVSKGRKYHSNGFTLQALPDMRSPVGRIGYTVTKKEGNAVERNRIRRRLREIIRTDSTMPIIAGCDYVLIARRSSLFLSNFALVDALKTAFGLIHSKKPSQRTHERIKSL
jgi:ribonuclease P protein component